jgi:prophage DNA circulation protein
MMLKDEASEAVPIVQRALLNLLTITPTRGSAGADLKAAVGLLYASAEQLIYLDQLGQPLSDCFELARTNNITQSQLDWVRQQTELELPVTVGATMIKESIIRLCLVTEGLVIANMTFVSRTDVENLKNVVNGIFDDAEEIAADEMDQMTYRALVELHAGIIAFLVETARPLPDMLNFIFTIPMPTLTMANRLYYDASRADEMRNENLVVHPLFMRPTGRALSS